MRPPPARPVLQLQASMTWPQFWHCVSGELRRRGYSVNSLQLYRQVLRGLRDAGLHRPAAISPSWVRGHIESIACRGASWSWIAANICIIRTAFDKLAGCRLTTGLRTPKRPHCLPRFLYQHEALEILRAARTIRDQLLLGLLYGCGLKVGELCALRWHDVGIQQRRLRIVFARGTRTR